MSSQISELPELPEPECTKTVMCSYITPTIRPGPENKPRVGEEKRDSGWKKKKGERINSNAAII